MSLDSVIQKSLAVEPASPALAQNFSGMPEFSSGNPRKDQTDLKLSKRQPQSVSCPEEEDARIAEIKRTQENLVLIAGEPLAPVSEAIRRAYNKVRWRNEAYFKRLWYGEIEFVPSYIARRIETIAREAAAEQIRAHEQRAATLRKYLGEEPKDTSS